MSPTENLFILLSVLTIFNSGVLSQDVNRITLEDGEFKNVLVAIDEGVQEDPTIIQNIKDMFMMGSPLLFNATQFRVFWKEILILVPRSWTRLSSHGIAQSESYNRANIRIFSGDESTDPVVVNHLQCGKEGYHLDMTSGYLQNTSKCHKMDIVRYWARLRWSLMPEDYTGDHNTAPSYIASSKERQATRCSLEIEGHFFDPITMDKCQTNIDDEYLKHCVFQTEGCSGKQCSSLMFGSHCIGSIVEFCNSNSKDIHRYHNFEAPNLQNIKCDNKSAWDVLYDSDDFKNEKNPPRPPGTNTAPSFRIVQPSDVGRVVLVLDISGSMNIENRFNKLIQAATIFIMDLVPAGSEVGIVSFHSFPVTNAPLHEIRDGDSSREDLINLLPPSTGGSTCIGCGILEAINPGNWDITMLHNESSNERVGLTVTTKPRQTAGDDTADVHVFLSARTVNFTADPKLGIFALVQRGHNVVKNADVQAFVDNSIGSITTQIPLHDKGTGSDFMKDDGVYSGYFLNFDADGRYSVTVNVLGAAASHISRTNRKRRAVTPTPPSVPSSFMRSASGGVFVVNNYIPNAPDVLAPSRIQDLAYSSFSYENATVILTWTAVGDDLDQGTASDYELRYSNYFDVLRVNFTMNPLVNDHQIIDGNLSRISPGGQSETLTILLPVLHYDLNYYFSIRALDEAGNAGAISNIVSLPVIEPYLVSTLALSSTTTGQDFTDGTNVTTSTITEPPSKEPEATKGPDESKDLGLIIGLTVAVMLVVLVCVLVYARFFYKKKHFMPRFGEGVNQSGDNYQSTETHANPAYNVA